MKPFFLLLNLLSMIEGSLNEIQNAEAFADSLSISSVHLQRIFKFAFNVPLSSYIRSRRLTASLETLLKTNFNIIDIANDYGFVYEQSYIRAFKREFGLTPGELRKTGQIVRITPPLQLFESNKLADGILFGPEIVMVPSFHVIGRRGRVAFKDSVELPPKMAKKFWSADRCLIKNSIKNDVYIGLTRIPETTDFSYYLTGVQAKSLEDIPNGFDVDTFPTSLCARFHYIGQHHYYDITADVARGMYNAIVAFANDKSARYASCHDKLYFERIDTAAYDGAYCQMEWFTPLFERK